MNDIQQELIAALKALNFDFSEICPDKEQKTPIGGIFPQQIFYGAPGTGKSHRIKKNEKVKNADEKNLVFRTTFHPDSDYSTFVGAYKPWMKENVISKNGVESKEEQIVYRFVPQAFTKAYIAAWDNQEENVFLIIEEINRGNCAQIFGDLFQLLDRDNAGFSEYPIFADSDLAKYLNGKDDQGLDVLTNKDGIKDGKLKLPPNLYIWATMNTSDQSLFPIDSAFKRRWEWEYIPITESEDDRFKISVGDKSYDWWSFVSKMNKVVENVTSSEDKQLGFYFCKPDEGDNIITAKKFVNKVLFYLCNDVFKNYGYDALLNGKKVFSYINAEGKDDTMAFTSFFTSNGKPNLKSINQLMKNLEVEEFQDENENIGAEMTQTKTLNVTYKGNVIGGNSAKEVFINTIEQIVADKGADAVAEIIGAEMTNNPSQNTTRDYRQINNSGWYLATRNGVERFARHLNNLRNGLDIDLGINMS